MEKRSKTIEELFEQKYPLEEILEKPSTGIEAIGYLKAIEEYFPSEQIWVKPKTTALLFFESKQSYILAYQSISVNLNP